MDIGLYTLKYPFRKLIGFLIPWFKNSNPNNISWFLVVIGLLMSTCYWFALNANITSLLWFGIALGFVRMIVATLDGLVAIEYKKSSTLGDLINRLTPEICDLLLYPVLVIATRHLDILGMSVLTMSWAISYFGLLGVASGCPIQSVGPTGQTDRLAALMLFSFFQIVGDGFGWKVHFFDIFFYWILIGGVLTLWLRWHRSFRAAQEKDKNIGKSIH